MQKLLFYSNIYERRQIQQILQLHREEPYLQKFKSLIIQRQFDQLMNLIFLGMIPQQKKKETGEIIFKLKYLHQGYEINEEELKKIEFEYIFKILQDRGQFDQAEQNQKLKQQQLQSLKEKIFIEGLKFQIQQQKFMNSQFYLLKGLYKSEEFQRWSRQYITKDYIYDGSYEKILESIKQQFDHFETIQQERQSFGSEQSIQIIEQFILRAILQKQYKINPNLGQNSKPNQFVCWKQLKKKLEGHICELEIKQKFKKKGDYETFRLQEMLTIKEILCPISMPQLQQKIKGLSALMQSLSNAVLIVGSTGVGKTTLIQTLFGYEHSYSSKGLILQTQLPNQHKTLIAKDGISSQKLITYTYEIPCWLYPAEYKQKDNLVLIDCPEFNNTQEIETKLYNYLIKKRIIGNIKKVKIIHVVKGQDLVPQRAKVKHFADMLINNYYCTDTKSISSSLIIVFSGNSNVIPKIKETIRQLRLEQYNQRIMRQTLTFILKYLQDPRSIIDFKQKKEVQIRKNIFQLIFKEGSDDNLVQKKMKKNCKEYANLKIDNSVQKKMKKNCKGYANLKIDNLVQKKMNTNLKIMKKNFKDHLEGHRLFEAKYFYKQLQFLFNHFPQFCYQITDLPNLIFEQAKFVRDNLLQFIFHAYDKAGKPFNENPRQNQDEFRKILKSYKSKLLEFKIFTKQLRIDELINLNAKLQSFLRNKKEALLHSTDVNKIQSKLRILKTIDQNFSFSTIEDVNEQAKYKFNQIIQIIKKESRVPINFNLSKIEAHKENAQKYISIIQSCTESPSSKMIQFEAIVKQSAQKFFNEGKRLLIRAINKAQNIFDCKFDNNMQNSNQISMFKIFVQNYQRNKKECQSYQKDKLIQIDQKLKQLIQDIEDKLRNSQINCNHPIKRKTHNLYESNAELEAHKMCKLESLSKEFIFLSENIKDRLEFFDKHRRDKNGQFQITQNEILQALEDDKTQLTNDLLEEIHKYLVEFNTIRIYSNQTLNILNNNEAYIKILVKLLRKIEKVKEHLTHNSRRQQYLSLKNPPLSKRYCITFQIINILQKIGQQIDDINQKDDIDKNQKETKVIGLIPQITQRYKQLVVQVLQQIKHNFNQSYLNKMLQLEAKPFAHLFITAFQELNFIKSQNFLQRNIDWQTLFDSVEEQLRKFLKRIRQISEQNKLKDPNMSHKIYFLWQKIWYDQLKQQIQDDQFIKQRPINIQSILLTIQNSSYNRLKDISNILKNQSFSEKALQPIKKQIGQWKNFSLLLVTDKMEIVKQIAQIQCYLQKNFLDSPDKIFLKLRSIKNPIAKLKSYLSYYNEEKNKNNDCHLALEKIQEQLVSLGFEQKKIQDQFFTSQYITIRNYDQILQSILSIPEMQKSQVVNRFKQFVYGQLQIIVHQVRNHIQNACQLVRSGKIVEAEHINSRIKRLVSILPQINILCKHDQISNAIANKRQRLQQIKKMITQQCFQNIALRLTKEQFSLITQIDQTESNQLQLLLDRFFSTSFSQRTNSDTAKEMIDKMKEMIDNSRSIIERLPHVEQKKKEQLLIKLRQKKLKQIYKIQENICSRPCQFRIKMRFLDKLYSQSEDQQYQKHCVKLVQEEANKLVKQIMKYKDIMTQIQYFSKLFWGCSINNQKIRNVFNSIDHQIALKIYQAVHKQSKKLTDFMRQGKYPQEPIDVELLLVRQKLQKQYEKKMYALNSYYGQHFIFTNQLQKLINIPSQYLNLTQISEPNSLCTQVVKDFQIKKQIIQVYIRDKFLDKGMKDIISFYSKIRKIQLFVSSFSKLIMEVKNYKDIEAKLIQYVNLLTNYEIIAKIRLESILKIDQNNNIFISEKELQSEIIQKLNKEFKTITKNYKQMLNKLFNDTYYLDFNLNKIMKAMNFIESNPKLNKLNKYKNYTFKQTSTEYMDKKITLLFQSIKTAINEQNKSNALCIKMMTAYKILITFNLEQKYAKRFYELLVQIEQSKESQLFIKHLEHYSNNVLYARMIYAILKSKVTNNWSGVESQNNRIIYYFVQRLKSKNIAQHTYDLLNSQNLDGAHQIAIILVVWANLHPFAKLKSQHFTILQKLITKKKQGRIIQASSPFKHFIIAVTACFISLTSKVYVIYESKERCKKYYQKYKRLINKCGKEKIKYIYYKDIIKTIFKIKSHQQQTINYKPSKRFDSQIKKESQNQNNFQWKFQKFVRNTKQQNSQNQRLKLVFEDINIFLDRNKTDDLYLSEKKVALKFLLNQSEYRLVETNRFKLAQKWLRKQKIDKIQMNNYINFFKEYSTGLMSKREFDQKQFNFLNSIQFQNLFYNFFVIFRPQYIFTSQLQLFSSSNHQKIWEQFGYSIQQKIKNEEMVKEKIGFADINDGDKQKIYIICYKSKQKQLKQNLKQYCNPISFSTEAESDEIKSRFIDALNSKKNVMVEQSKLEALIIPDIQYLNERIEIVQAFEPQSRLEENIFFDVAMNLTNDKHIKQLFDKKKQLEKNMVLNFTMDQMNQGKHKINVEETNQENSDGNKENTKSSSITNSKSKSKSKHEFQYTANIRIRNSSSDDDTN